MSYRIKTGLNACQCLLQCTIIVILDVSKQSLISLKCITHDILTVYTRKSNTCCAYVIQLNNSFITNLLRRNTFIIAHLVTQFIQQMFWDCYSKTNLNDVINNPSHQLYAIFLSLKVGI